MSLRDKNIIIGICGSIAAYKIAHLTRLLVKERANVQVIMTPDATEFITPLTLATLSKNPVLSAYFDKESGVWNNHVELGLKADLLLIAPATATTISKMAHGIADNLLLATYLSAKCPVMFAPAMDLDMWLHPATQENINRLVAFGDRLIAPKNGELASGLVGEGRLTEPEEIVATLRDFFNGALPLRGKKALVSAGPTYEAIDPVRFIGNHSSGKMGFAIAETLQNLGAEVILISGPTHLPTPPGVYRTDVVSASDMLSACSKHFDQSDIIVMSAAVADYTPLEVSDQKIKKKDETFQIPLKKTTDILASLGKRKTNEQTLIGFALETNDELAHAKDKLIRKNLDYIVLNSMRDIGAGFAVDTNKVTVLERNGGITYFELKDKKAVAQDICQLVVSHQSTINS
ncbi:bifunctional phosphopantothenoylcysteine decarboxylase/phosphopantothenate--cysteine ligase CoaBC [Sphingobacterium suaedae]|uniref:Coenzyme A biosynthesis bifunctional protein CoaBC n=1 Tax=Sphingobacterium suaedae TaxID=1686402 RepID=A0ABW5KMH7_9SPHI